MVIITEKTLKKLVKEFLITIGLLSIATVIGMLLIYIGFTESNVIMVYLLCVLLISIFTNGYIWSVAGSLVSVVLLSGCALLSFYSFPWCFYSLKFNDKQSKRKFGKFASIYGRKKKGMCQNKKTLVICFFIRHGITRSSPKKDKANLRNPCNPVPIERKTERTKCYLRLQIPSGRP